MYYRAYPPRLIHVLPHFWPHHKNRKLFFTHLVSAYVVSRHDVNHTWRYIYRLSEIILIWTIILQYSISIHQNILMFVKLLLYLQQHQFQFLRKWIRVSFSSQLCVKFWKLHYLRLIQFSIIQITIHNTLKIMLLIESLHFHLYLLLFRIPLLYTLDNRLKFLL